MSKLTGVAEQINKLGIVVGDTVIGQHKSICHSHEAMLTLLWVGNEKAVWLVSERGTNLEEWSKPEESTAWSLDNCRTWAKVPKKPAPKEQL